MPMHAVFVNDRTLDFIERVNGGVRPSDEYLREPTLLIYSDRLDDAQPNKLVKLQEFKDHYEWHPCDDDNCNIVEKVC